MKLSMWTIDRANQFLSKLRARFGIKGERISNLEKANQEMNRLMQLSAKPETNKAQQRFQIFTPLRDPTAPRPINLSAKTEEQPKDFYMTKNIETKLEAQTKEIATLSAKLTHVTSELAKIPKEPAQPKTFGEAVAFIQKTRGIASKGQAVALAVKEYSSFHLEYLRSGGGPI